MPERGTEYFRTPGGPAATAHGATRRRNNGRNTDATRAGTRTRQRPTRHRAALPTLALLCGMITLLCPQAATAQSSSLHAVKNLRILPASSGTLLAQWSMSGSEGDDHDYEVDYTSSGTVDRLAGVGMDPETGWFRDPGTHSANPDDKAYPGDRMQYIGGGNLTNGRTYRVRVRITKDRKVGTWHFKRGVPNATQPFKPINVAVNPGDTKLHLRWQESPAGGKPTSYQVHYTSDGDVSVGATAGTDPSREWKVSSDTVPATATSYTVTGLTNNKTYRVRVRGRNANPPRSDITWEEATGTPRAPGASHVPSIVTNLVTEAVGPEELRVVWTPAANADTYDVQYTSSKTVSDTAAIAGADRKLANKGWVYAPEGDETDPRDGARKRRLIPNLTSSTEYRVRVRGARHYAGTQVHGPWEWTKGTPVAGRPGEPRRISATADHGALIVSWEAVERATSYDVHYTASSLDVNGPTGDDASTHWKDAGHIGSGTSQTITGLANGTGYKVRVRGRHGTSHGPWGANRGRAEPRVRTITLEVRPERVPEGESVTVEATAGYAVATDVEIRVKTTAGSAEDGDYEPLEAVTIKAGTRTGTGSIATTADSDTENDTFSVGLGDLSGVPASAGEANARQVTIVEIAQVSLSASPETVDEGDTVTLKTTLTSALPDDVTIPLSAETGNHLATPGEDYGDVGAITIAAGETTGTVAVTTKPDNAADAGDERLVVTLGDLTGTEALRRGTPAEVQVIIRDADRKTLSLSADPSQVEEGSAITVKATLTGPNGNAARTGEAIRVPVSFNAGTTEPEDFDPPQGSFEIVIGVGEHTGTYRIETAEDEDGDLEQFTVEIDPFSLKLPPTVSKGVSRIGVTITDKDAPTHAFSVSDAHAYERPRNQYPRICFGIGLHPAAATKTSVQYHTEDGTAKHRQEDNGAGATAGDYTATTSPLVLTFEAGETNYTKCVGINHDQVEDSGEYFYLVLSNPTGAVLAKARGKGTIYNHEATSLSGLVAEGAASEDGPFSSFSIGTFNRGTVAYTATVPHATTHARLTARATTEGLDIRTGPEGGTLSQLPASGGTGPANKLAIGENALVVRTQFEDQSATYKVTITRQEATAPIASADADLSGLSAEARTGGNWSTLDIGSFSASTTTYSATVQHGTTEARLTATTADGKATVKVGTGSNLSAVTSGNASGAIDLDVGANGLTVEVTAEDGTTKTYTVTVTRKARELSSNANLSGLTAEVAADDNWSALDIGSFFEGTTEYSATVPHRMSEARLTATAADSKAGLKAGTSGSMSTVASGSASAAIDLDVGANALSVVVTAEDGSTRTYGVRMERSEPPKPLTAEFENIPDEHDGDAAFTLDVRFSETLDGTGPTAASFDVGLGKAQDVEDLGDGVWRVHVKPKNWKEVTVKLAGGRDCSTAGAVCTADGRALENTLTESVDGPVRITIQDAKAREGKDPGIDFAVTLKPRTATETVTVDYETADGTATAGEDYEAVSGTLTFAAGETEKTVHVPVLDDDIDEGNEKFVLKLSNESGAYVRNIHREATGTIRNTDLIPAALLARFGRATAEQVVTQIEERMTATRERGFRARFAGREIRPGQEREFALGLVSQFAQPSGMAASGAARMGSGYTAPMGATMHTAAPGAFGLSATGMGASDGTTAGRAPMGGYSPGGARQGSGPLGPMGMGDDLLSDSEFELNRESRGGILSLWSRSSRSHFTGMEDALSLNGDVRTTMVGADYSRGPLTVGLSVGRTQGLGGYSGRSGGQMTTSMTGVYPWVGYQVNERVSVWGTTGYGAGGLSLTPDGRSALETGVSMMMAAIGTRGELIDSRATGGFALAFKADALHAGVSSDLLEGPAGRLNASNAGVTRVRTALEGSRGFTLGGRLSLTPSVEVGLRRDGGDAETGAGMDVGSGLAFSDTVTGLSLDVRVRTLVVHQAEGFTERGMSLSFGWDPTPSNSLGLTARIAPSWGGSAQGGAEALWGGQMAYGAGSHRMYGAGDRVDAEVGYGLPVGTRFVGTPRVGLTTSEYGRDYRVGYGLGVLDQGDVNFELGVDAQRRESGMQGKASNGVMGRATLGW